MPCHDASILQYHGKPVAYVNAGRCASHAAVFLSVYRMPSFAMTALAAKIPRKSPATIETKVSLFTQTGGCMRKYATAANIMYCPHIVPPMRTSCAIHTTAQTLHPPRFRASASPPGGAPPPHRPPSHLPPSPPPPPARPSPRPVLVCFVELLVLFTQMEPEVEVAPVQGR